MGEGDGEGRNPGGSLDPWLPSLSDAQKSFHIKFHEPPPYPACFSFYTIPIFKQSFKWVPTL